MTVLRFDGAEDSSFDLSDVRNLTIAQVLTTDATNWRYTNENGTTVQFLGTGFTYDGDGRAISGTIETVRVVLPSGDVFAIDQALDAAAVAANPAALWDTVMSGNDVINLLELGNETDQISTVFGDAISAARSRDRDAVTGTGGNDVFILGSGSYRLLGDVETVSGIDVFLKVDGGRPKDIFARYQGGNDLITGAETDQQQRIVGDAGVVGANGTLVGGDDTLSILSSDGGSYVSGDAEEAFGIKGAIATVIGGDDEIKGLKDSTATLVGDLVFANAFVTLRGGNDTILGSQDDEVISGDLGVANQAKSTRVIGGDDLISGGGGADRIAGDSFHEPENTATKGGGARLTVKGGDDVIDGGDGDDIIYGDVFILSDSAGNKSGASSAPRISGGNDEIDGGAGRDVIFGQTGNDRIDGGEGQDELSGGAGKDRITGGLYADFMRGGKGADLFIYESVDDSGTPNSDIILDFSTRQGDRIDLRLVDADADREGLQKFRFIGSAADGDIGDLRVLKTDGNTFLLADTDGDGVDDFQITISKEMRLTAEDFLF